MKKVFIIFSIAVMVYACGNENADDKTTTQDNATSAPETPAAEPAVQDVTQQPDYQKGLELIAQSDCLTCHKVDEKAIGPPYRDVANKYTSDDSTINRLAGKIVKGGTGVWGNIPMTPHPNVSNDDAKQMVKYILLLKNK